MSELSEKIRSEFKSSDDIRDAGLSTPEDIIRYDDILYGSYQEWQVLDVYRPKDREGELLPVIVSFHGGAWVYGDKERYQYYCMSLAERGFAVVNFTYRLAPEFKFPTPLEDANLVFKWILANADRYSFDTQRIFGVGDSAGGHLLGLYAAIMTNPAYRSEFDFAIPEGLALRGLALNCGVYEINTGKFESLYPLMQEFLTQKGTTEELNQVNLIEHITEYFPRTFLMSATGDSQLCQVMPMLAKLTQMKVPFEYHFYGDSAHELGHVFHCNMRSEAAKKCNDDECQFFLSI